MLTIILAAVQAKVQLGGEDQDHRQQLHGGCRTHPRGGGGQAGCKIIINQVKKHVALWKISREQHFAVILIEFAFQLMLLLDQINKESFQVNKETF